MIFQSVAELKAEQLSVFLENRAGRLAEVIHLLADAGINISALSLADTSDFGILRMMVSDLSRAGQALKAHGFTIGHTDVLVVEMPDVPGSLDKLLMTVSRHGINVEYMYAGTRRSLDQAVMIFRFDKMDSAIEVLQATGFAVLPKSLSD